MPAVKKRKPYQKGRNVFFDGYTYPLPMPDISWRCRYAPEKILPSEFLAIASVMDAYFAMVTSDTQKKRNYVCSEMRKIIDEGDWY